MTVISLRFYLKYIKRFDTVIIEQNDNPPYFSYFSLSIVYNTFKCVKYKTLFVSHFNILYWCFRNIYKGICTFPCLYTQTELFGSYGSNKIVNLRLELHVC